MAGDIQINLEIVRAMFEHCENNEKFQWYTEEGEDDNLLEGGISYTSPVGMASLSEGRNVFTHDWGDLGITYGAAFRALLRIIAEETEVIMPIDKCFVKEYPKLDKQAYETVLCTRSMPHNRAHWIMRHVLEKCV